ncbi:c-type cytochrome [Persephonella sp.]
MMKKFVLIGATAIIFIGCQEKKEETGGSHKIEKQQTVQIEQEQNKPETMGKKAVNLNGEALFKAKGCSACHQPEKESVGPSLSKISQVYSKDKSKLISFLKGEGKPIVDPQKFGIMSPQLSATKDMSDKELSALADYILKY